MRILLPFQVEKSTEINFSWGVNDDDFDEDCDLFIRKVKFLKNNTISVDFCPMFFGMTIEPYQLVRLIRCET